ncbi:hypothetical protein [Geobacillus sp. 47C-IIb]|uniref:hypothetical protein n=1 Tax=Geobacillus sp. 47C-IIb TaxID=1963026 RepID=UPI001681B176|nr:hypothetical protein [Geobacillus sp. 47C-IIb]QNU30265.1 hypothetical protein IC804_12230 [Geobacillus sp. 47C-IIb]
MKVQKNSTFHAVKNGWEEYPLVEIHDTYVNSGDNSKKPRISGVTLEKMDLCKSILPRTKEKR